MRSLGAGSTHFYPLLFLLWMILFHTGVRQRSACTQLVKMDASGFAGSRVASLSLMEHGQDIPPLPGSCEDGQHSEGFGMIPSLSQSHRRAMEIEDLT